MLSSCGERDAESDHRQGRPVDSKAATVDTPKGTVRCVIRGRLAEARTKDGDSSEQILVVGDEVRVQSGSIPAGHRGDHAPANQALATGQPRATGRAGGGGEHRPAGDRYLARRAPLNLNLVDRYLVAADTGGLSAAICVNKVDLPGRDAAAGLLAAYETLGYPVLWTSATLGTGIAELGRRLAGRTSVMAGKSGVGKSALLTAVEPGLGLKSRAISASTGKGRHTTSFSSLLPLSSGGYVIDTPGIRKYTLWEVDPRGLDRHFPEIDALRGQCRFANCTHSHEPGCAVRDAVDAGTIDRRRHASYLRILEGLDEE
jgi:ribosome biogenesis GTPase